MTPARADESDSLTPEDTRDLQLAVGALTIAIIGVLLCVVFGVAALLAWWS